MAGDIGAATARLLFEAGAVQVSRDRPFIRAGQAPSMSIAGC